MINNRIEDQMISISRSFLIIVLLILILIPIVSSSQNENLTVRVGVYNNPPKVYSDNNGGYKGFYPEIIELIAQNEGWKVEYVFGNWTTCMDRLESGELDIMMDVAYSEERAVIYDFNNETVFNNWGVIYTTMDSMIESLPDLEGKKIAVMRGSIHTEGEQGIDALIKNFNINCTYVEVDSYEDVFRLVDSGAVDAGVVNRLFGEIQKNNFNVKRTNIIFDPSELRFAFPKNAALNAALIEGIDSNLKAMKADKNSQYYALIDEYVLASNSNQKVIIPEWVLPTLGISSITIVFLLLASVTLRWQVNRRTEDLMEANKNLEAEVTKQRETEIKLRESEGRFKAIASNTPDYIVMQDSQLKYIFVVNSPLGLAEEEMIGKTDYYFFPKEKADELASAKQKVMETGKPLHLEPALTSKEGIAEFYDGTYVPKYDNDGKIDGVIGYFRNVTERKQAEKEIMNAKLMAESASRAKSQFLANMSHELRTPLNAIIGFSDVLNSKVAGELTEKQQSYIKNINNSGKHLLAVINDVLDLSKIESGKMELECEKFSAAEMFNEVLTMMVPMASKKNISIIVDNKAWTDELFADRLKIKQILYNLLSNAIKFTPDHGKVFVIAEKKDKEVRISVSDSGIGIPQNMQDSIFNPFTQVDASNRRVYGGTGLGLALVKQFVEMHKGSIWVESEEGKGSTFTFTIADQDQCGQMKQDQIKAE